MTIIHNASDLEPLTIDDEDAKRFTIGWICAIDVELAAAKAALDSSGQKTKKIKRPNDLNTYHQGKIGSHWVVVGCQHTMGQDAAADLCTSMKRSFSNIEDFLVVGVAGAIPHYKIGREQQSIVLGDVVISSPWPGSERSAIVAADHGTTTRAGFRPSYRAIREPSERFKIALSNFRQETAIAPMGNPPRHLEPSYVIGVLNSVPQTESFPQVVDPGEEKDFLIKAGHPHGPSGNACGRGCLDFGRLRSGRQHRPHRQPNTPYVHMGLVASYRSFSASRVKLRDLDSGVLCAEMEAASVAHRYPTITIRGIMDYCDMHRVHMTEWKCYAAVTAATATKLLISLLPDDSRT